MNQKPRILLVNEFSQLASGYAVYGMEIMKRLHATAKYELGEVACYTMPGDPRITQLPWKVFPNYPDESRRQEVDEYHSKRSNEFGEFAFDRACLQFRPDIVFSIRDFWMDEFIERSPFRSFYHWVVMPTVDSAPQHEQWIATFMNADAVFTYSDWGTEVLKKEGGGLINTQGSAPPGADLKTFHPMDKAALRHKFKFEDDINIIGTIMRNQGRKLYPELIESFVMFLKQAPPQIAKKTYLYLHTSYPDQGWDIPRLIKKYGVSHKTLVTYKCRKCPAVFPSFFMDVSGPCMGCGQPSARMPNPQEGIDRTRLARVINLFDCYVQYANSEGFGMPMVEAAACGIPVFATDYSAMSDVVRKVNGYPIKVDRYRLDNDFGCYRAVPSNQDLVDKWIHFFQLPEGERKRKSLQARQGVEKHYTWEQTAKKWEKVFDNLMDSKSSNIKRQSWKSSARIHNPLPVPKQFESNEELVRWAILNVLGMPEMTNSYLSLRLIRDLNWGLSMKTLGGGNYANEQSILATRGNLQPFGSDDMIRELKLMCENRNKWEQRRWQTITQDSSLQEKI
jgi:glycosyltransferase involved in cell wall biosynthesis